MGLATSGGINVWGEFNADSRTNFIVGLTTFLLKAGWMLDSVVSATATGDFTTVSVGNLFGAGANTYHFANGSPGGSWNAVPNNVKPGDIQNLIDAINGEPSTKGVAYSSSTKANGLLHASAGSGSNNILLTSNYPGPYGNGIFTQMGNLLGGGYKATGLSPQTQTTNPLTPLAVQVYVHDTQLTASSQQLANVQLISKLDPTINTRIKNIYCAPGVKYRVVANRCQFFVYQPGVAADVRGSVVTGGIPWVPGASTCADEVTSVGADESFWLMSDKGNPGATARTVVGGIPVHFSQSQPESTTVITDAGNTWAGGDASFNQQPTGDSTQTNGLVRIISLTPPDNYPLGANGIESPATWLGEIPMKLEPLVGWGVPNSAAYTEAIGQLYDAWILTQPAAMDQITTFDDATWLAFTNNHKFGTLWLKVPALTPEQLAPAGYAF